MYIDMVFDNHHAKLQAERASLEAAEQWRFRHLASRERKVLAAVLTTVFRLFVW